ncbi:MAG: sulfatase [Acidobacteriota bacterium]
MWKYVVVILALTLSACGRREAVEVYDLGRNVDVAELDGPADARPETTVSAGFVKIFQKAGTSISYYIKLDADSVLAFGIGSEPPDGPSKGPVPEYVVTVRTEDEKDAVQVYRDGWTGRLLRRVGLRKNIRVSLPRIRGIVRVTLKVQSEDNEPATGIWVNPRVEGRSSASPVSTSAASGSTMGGGAPSDAGPSFMIVLLDAARRDRFGCYGYGGHTTPNIDRFAADSVVFQNAYCEAVYTQASVGSLLTSEYPDRHGSVRKGYGLGPDTRTIAQVLQEAGWETGLITASPNASSLYGYERGFDTVSELYKRPGGKGVVDAVEVADAGIDWLRAHSDKRFFLYLHFREPHGPLRPPPPFYGKFSGGYPGPLKDNNQTDDLFTLVNTGKLALTPEDSSYLAHRYDENLSYVDSEVGRLLEYLRSQKLLERTVLFLLGDHGEALGEHDFFGHNETLYQEASRIPLMMHLPSSPGYRSVGDPVGIIDVAATMAGLAHAHAQAGAFQGRSLVPAIRGESLAHVPLFTRTTGDTPAYGVMDDGYRYLYTAYGDRRELYELADDPVEKIDVAEERELRVGYMHQLYLLWAKTQASLAPASPPTQVNASPEDVAALAGLGYVDPGQGYGSPDVAGEGSEPDETTQTAYPRAGKEPKPKLQRKHGQTQPSEGAENGSRKLRREHRKTGEKGTTRSPVTHQAE